MRLFVVLAACMLLLAGCAQEGIARQAAAGNASFELPEAKSAYFARYTVEEGGIMQKEVWRAGNSMRADVAAQGQRVLSIFFINSRAYSCSYAPAPTACYDVTALLSQGGMAKLAPAESDFSGAARAESVKIGNTTGNCYEADSGAAGARKVCFAIGGVVAYDSYNVSRSVAHTEYLTDLEYYPAGGGPDAGVFALPAQPVAAPVVQTLPSGE